MFINYLNLQLSKVETSIFVIHYSDTDLVFDFLQVYNNPTSFLLVY